jgi:DnaB helicase-like protein/AAA domain-containing protein
MTNSQQKIKIAPHSKDSEMMVLGCMLTSINSLNVAADALDDTDFYFRDNQIIFQVLKAAYVNDKPADVHLVCEELRDQNKLKTVGGVAYITTLAQYAGTSAYIEEYVKIVRDKSILRRLITAAQQVVNEALEEPDDAQQMLDEAQQLFTEIQRSGQFQKDKFPIKFLNQFDKNFLLVVPPKKPMLLEYADEQGSPVGFLPKGIVAMLVGAGGIGKTHLLAQLVVAMATATPWLGMFTTTNHCGPNNCANVFIGLGENQYEDIHRVLYKAVNSIFKNDKPEDEKPILEASHRIAAFSFCGQQAAFIEDGRPSRYFRDFKNRLIEKAPKGGWSLIVLDPVSRLMGADAETDNAAATQFIALLEELTIDLPGNPTVLFAHHISKAALRTDAQDQTASRGASGLTDGARLQLNFIRAKEKEENVTILKMTKSNFTAIMADLKLEKDGEGIHEKRTNERRQEEKKAPHYAYKNEN